MPPTRSARARRSRRAVALVLATLLVVPVAVVFGTPAQAARRSTVMASAATYARTQGYHVGIAVLDTKTGQFYGSGDYAGAFASESVVKVFIATRLLIAGRMHGRTSRLAYKMITQSDDGIASSLYGGVGGDGLIAWVKGYFHVPGLGYRPSRSNWWGNTHIRPKGLVRLYARLEANRRVGPWLLNAMHHATHYGSDGAYQFFGLPSATHGAAIKQGWGDDFDDWSASADFNTTGFVDNDRYAVAILARGPISTYGSKIAAMLTRTARRLLPHGTFPAPRPTITALSRHTGRASGGTTVTVFGTDLFGLRRVYFGRTPALTLQRISTTRLRAVAPAHLPGTVRVRITTGHGSTTAVTTDRFSYVAPPTVTSVNPRSGPSAGGQTVTITGSGFTAGSRVLFGSKAAVAATPSGTSLRVKVPPHHAGTVDVRVVTAYGESAVGTGDRYVYLAP